MQSQPVTANPGTKSPIGGTSGRTCRRTVQSPLGRVARPDLICGADEPIASNTACTSPARRAECAAGAPR